MRWSHVVGMAILSGIITGVLAQTSFLADTSFSNITVTYEWWVFFLISQTLVFFKEFHFAYWYLWIEMVLWTASDALLVWLRYINQEGILGDVIQALPISLLCFVEITYCILFVQNPHFHLSTIVFCSSFILVLCFKREVNRLLALLCFYDFIGSYGLFCPSINK